MGKRPSAEHSPVHHRLGQYELIAATRYGPRIIGLRLKDGPQMLARLGPNVRIEHPASGVYTFRGGHRLWAAPEVPKITYAAEDEPCDVTAGPDRLKITGPVDAAGLAKQLEVSWDGSRLVVRHRLSRAEGAPIQVSPWAITQLPLGGVAIMPVRGASSAPPLQADRSLVVWPYTKLDDARLTLNSTSALIHATSGPPLKLGTGPSPAKLGYIRAGHLFVKEFDNDEDGLVPDRGAVGQVFVNEDFCELESIGPITTLDAGSEAWHTESWEVIQCDQADAAIEHVTAGR